MCGCRQSSQRQGATVSAASASSRSAGSASSRSAASSSSGNRRQAYTSVTLVYRGARALLVRGPATGAGYACYPGESIRVHSPDVPHLVASGAFARAG